MKLQSNLATLLALTTSTLASPTAGNTTTSPTPNNSTLHTFDDRSVWVKGRNFDFDLRDCTDIPGYTIVCCDRQPKKLKNNGDQNQHCLDLQDPRLKIDENGKCEPKSENQDIPNKYRSGPWCKVPDTKTDMSLIKLVEKGLFGRDSNDGQDILSAYRNGLYAGMSGPGDYRLAFEKEVRKCYGIYGGLPDYPYDHLTVGKVFPKEMTECLWSAASNAFKETGPQYVQQ